MMENPSLRCRGVQVLSGFVYSKMRFYLFSLSLEFLPKIEQKDPHVLCSDFVYRTSSFFPHSKCLKVMTS